MDNETEIALTGRSGAGLLRVMESTAREVGVLLRDRFGTTLQVDEKSPRNYVTEVDRQSETLIRDRLLAEYPDFGFLGEESDESHGNDSRMQWIVDPVDGTRNLVHEVPIYCLSIGLANAGRPVAGVIYDPLRDELFSSAPGEPPRLNGKPTGVSSTAELGHCLIAFDLGKSSGAYRQTHAILGELMPRFQSIRSLGSQALAMAYVASGRFDLYFNMKSSPWDVAAGIALVRSNGGDVTDMSGGDSAIPIAGLVAGNPSVVAQFTEAVAGAF